jgi:hypothetical protein
MPEIILSHIVGEHEEEVRSGGALRAAVGDALPGTAAKSSTAKTTDASSRTVLLTRTPPLFYGVEKKVETLAPETSPRYATSQV